MMIDRTAIVLDAGIEPGDAVIVGSDPGIA
jgi:hypothetical protein